MTDPTPHEAHRREADCRANADPVRCAVLTISDTRTEQTDEGGPLIVRHLEQSGHDIVSRAIVKDEYGAIDAQLGSWIADASIQVIITTGGTGVARRDTTIEVVRNLLTYELEGFGELFRMISYQQVQSAAMLSRAVAGLVIGDGRLSHDTCIFSLPGSTNAVETAMANLITPQLAHLVWERCK